MNFDKMKDALLAAAQRAGLQEYEIFAMSERSVSTETLRHEISSFSLGESGGISFRCIVDGRMGYASTELLTEAEMEELVDRAMDNARCIENDDEVFIYRGSERYEAVTAPRQTLPDAATLKERALLLERRAYEAHPSVSDGTQAGTVAFSSDILLCNSHGLELHNSVGASGAYIDAVVKQDGESVSAFEVTKSGDGAALDALAVRAVDRARAKLGASRVPSGATDCVISGRQMRSVLSAFWSMCSAKMVQHGMSLLKGRLGERIAADCVTISDDPRREECPIQTSFDGEGVATYRKNVIEDGVLKTYLYDLTTAKKDGVTSTGNGQRASYTSPVSIAPYCLCLEAGKSTLDALFDAMGEGIYITELKGIHAGADAVTGDFSLEAAGFRVREGKLAEPVKTFTVAGNFLELLKGIEDVSDTVDFGFPGSFTSFAAADVLVRGMSIAGE